MTMIDAEVVRPGPLERAEWGAFIDGAFVPVGQSPTFEVREPSTGAPLARVVAGDAALVDDAVRSARSALPAWRALSGRQRGAYLRQVAERIRANADELAVLVSREIGKPKRDALANDVFVQLRLFRLLRRSRRYVARRDHRPGSDRDQGALRALRRRRGILPFNWPPIHFAKKCAPALITGNTVVIKPGEQAPLTVLRLVEIANEVLPPGVLNAVPGLGPGAALAGHPHVERISFTGATATGRSVLESAAQNLTYATMELGGKNALMVLAGRRSRPRRRRSPSRACSTTRARHARPRLASSSSTSLLRRLPGEFTAAAASLVVGDGLDAEDRYRTDGRRATSAIACWPTCRPRSTRAPASLDQGTVPAERRTPTVTGTRRRCSPT